MTLRYERRDSQYANLPDYDGHAIHCLINANNDLVLATCVHRESAGTSTHEGPPATSGGGIRWRPNCATQSDIQIITDGLRLSKGMSEKAAALGESVGGAKTVVKWSGEREELWKAFATLILPHVPGYIMAEDSGTSWKDMTCIRHYAPKALIAGDTQDTDPSPTTADGVIIGIEVTLRALGLGSSVRVGDCTYAVSGVGAVGGAIVERLWQRGCRGIRIADPNQDRLNEVRAGRKGITIVPLERIHMEYVDVFVPCALGGSINKKTLPDLNCLAVAGCENNQLAEFEDGQILHELCILYAADFVINGGGLIKVFSKILKDRSVDDMLPRIGQNLQLIFDKSKAQSLAPSVVARQLAAERMKSTMLLPA